VHLAAGRVAFGHDGMTSVGRAGLALHMGTDEAHRALAGGFQALGLPYPLANAQYWERIEALLPAL
jgi:hypothetical protein